jgi:hypothetical protein
MKLTSSYELGFTMSGLIESIKEMMPTSSFFKSNYIEILFVIIFITALIIYFAVYKSTSSSPSNGDNTTAAAQAEKILAFSNPKKTSKRAIISNLGSMNMQAPSSLINFYALGCRYAGYLGPMESGYFDPDIAIQHSVNLGCRVFVLDIDYFDGQGVTTSYVPRIAVLDVQGKNMIQFNDKYKLNDPVGEIRKVCESINTYAFSPACQNAADPVIIVLYFQRKPPGQNNSPAVLTYYSKVAKALGPFQNRLISNEIHNGVFHRQKQEHNLLSGNITNYSGKVLIFSNANTSGFRESDMSFESHEDLDFLVNLRLTFTQTKLGITENDTTTSYGILQTAEDYMIIPTDRQSDIIAETKKRWTICLPRNPSTPVTPETYKKITSMYGVHCVPAPLFDTDACSFLFTDDLFKKYGFIPKPCPDPKSSSCLCYVPPPIVVASPASKTMDSAGGSLLIPKGPQ